MNNTEYARILSKGKSIEVAPWCEFAKYTNDCFKQSIISYKGALLLCIKTHVATAENAPKLLYEDPSSSDYITGIEKSEYWKFLLTGPKGTNGKNIILKREDDVIKWGYDFMSDEEYTELFTIKELAGAKAIHVGEENPIDYRNQHLDDPEVQAQYEHAEDMIWEDGQDEDPADEMYSSQEIDEKFEQQNETLTEQQNLIWELFDELDYNITEVIDEVYQTNQVLRRSLDCPPNDEIWFKNTIGDTWDPHPDRFDADIQSVSFDHDIQMYVIKFDWEVTELYYGDDRYYENVYEIYLPKSIYYIEESSFYGWNRLKRIHFGDINHIRYIGPYAFANTSLETFFWPDHVQEIPECCFSNSGLKEIIIPENVSLGYEAFSYCKYLEKVVLPDTMTSSEFGGSGEIPFDGCGEENSEELHFIIGKKIDKIYGDNIGFLNNGGATVHIWLRRTSPAILDKVAGSMHNYIYHVPFGSEDAYKKATNWSNLDIRGYLPTDIPSIHEEIASKDYVDTQIGNINTILETIITG